MTEPLRAANEIAEQKLYEITFYGEGSMTHAVNGIGIKTIRDFPRRKGLFAVIVLASYMVDGAVSNLAMPWHLTLTTAPTKA